MKKSGVDGEIPTVGSVAVHTRGRRRDAHHLRSGAPPGEELRIIIIIIIIIFATSF